jgi:hypothetical protein
MRFVVHRTHRRADVAGSSRDNAWTSKPNVTWATLINLGGVRAELGELPAARQTLERALPILKAAYGPGPPAYSASTVDPGQPPPERLRHVLQRSADTKV